jgi:hypothetical protein
MEKIYIVVTLNNANFKGDEMRCSFTIPETQLVNSAQTIRLTGGVDAVAGIEYKDSGDRVSLVLGLVHFYDLKVAADGSSKLNLVQKIDDIQIPLERFLSLKEKSFILTLIKDGE